MGQVIVIAYYCSNCWLAQPTYVAFCKNILIIIMGKSKLIGNAIVKYDVAISTFFLTIWHFAEKR